MTIERLSSDDGFKLDPKGDTTDRILNLLIRNSDLIRTLPPGRYDITPKWWTKHNFIHIVHVFPNGTAAYEGVPRFKDARAISFDKGKAGEFVTGSVVKMVPKDQNPVIVGGPLKDRKTMGVYEVILWHSGESPSDSNN